MAAVREPAPPDVFRRAVTLLRDTEVRPDVRIADMPAPQRLAPYSFALSGEVLRGDEELASGRLILLYDPDGHEAWNGKFRFVTLVRAIVDAEMAVDPLLGEVGWAWLYDALAAQGAEHRAAAGTVTRTNSESFGEIAATANLCEVELRASWTAADEAFDAHLRAWAEVMCSFAGLPPVPPGVATIARRRSRR